MSDIAIKCMRVIEHGDSHDNSEKIPEGKALIYMDDSGWVGTNNGFPFTGQPALFPVEQAYTLAQSWNSQIFNNKNHQELTQLKAENEKLREAFDALGLNGVEEYMRNDDDK